MDYEEIKQKLEAFETRFRLTIEEVIRIADLVNHGYEERIEKMDKIQKELDGVMKSGVTREIMVAYNKNLGESYLSALLKRRFDAVLEDIAEFKEGDVKHCLFSFFNIKLLYEILNFRQKWLDSPKIQ